MEEQIQSYRTVEFPHLRVKVHFMDLSKLKGVPIEGTAYTCIFGEDEDMHLDIAVFYEDIEKNVKKIAYMPMIIHEIVHALQYICEKRSIDMEEEKEHMGYMASYMTEQLLGLHTSPHSPIK